MTMPDGVYPSMPPEPNQNRKGKQPTLLTDEIVQILLANPNTWYRIGDSKKFISGVKHNIESMEQRNIAHLKHAGRFKIIQRKNNASNKVDIYCQFITTMEEE